MRVIVFKRAHWLGWFLACICLMSIFLVNVVGYIFGWKYISVFASMAEADKYEVRSRLLLDAMDYVGVCSPEEAARTWAKGLEMRSGALQYSVMSRELKKIYYQQLEKNFPNWVTGMSSPWISSYVINRAEATGDNTYLIEMTFSTATSTGPAGNYRAVLNLNREGSFWRISKISMDRGLFPYTGFSSVP